MSVVMTDVSAKRQSGRTRQLRHFRAPEFKREDVVVSRSLESITIVEIGPRLV